MIRNHTATASPPRRPATMPSWYARVASVVGPENGGELLLTVVGVAITQLLSGCRIDPENGIASVDLAGTGGKSRRGGSAGPGRGQELVDQPSDAGRLVGAHPLRGLVEGEMASEVS